MQAPQRRRSAPMQLPKKVVSKCYGMENGTGKTRIALAFYRLASGVNAR
jgi:hypothetical protein